MFPATGLNGQGAPGTEFCIDAWKHFCRLTELGKNIRLIETSKSVFVFVVVDVDWINNSRIKRLGFLSILCVYCVDLFSIPAVVSKLNPLAAISCLNPLFHLNAETSFSIFLTKSCS